MNRPVLWYLPFTVLHALPRRGVALPVSTEVAEVLPCRPRRGARRRRTPKIALAVPTLVALVVPAVSAGATSALAQVHRCVAQEATSPVAPVFAVGNGVPGPWPSEVLMKKATVQVLDPTTRSAYGLVSESRYSMGPDALLAFPLAGGAERDGPTFGLGGGYSDTLTLADRSLWVSGSVGKGDEPPGPMLCQVNPSTLHVVRQVSLPPPGPGNSEGLPTLVSEGSQGTVWVGYRSTLVHLEVRSGTVLSIDMVPSGTIASLATDPTGRLLYVSVSYPTIDGNEVDAAVEERTASNGELLATTSATSPVTGSVAGGILTALPDGVATSFRTGMDGETVLLHASGLAAIIPPGLGTAYRGIDTPPGDVFSWPMSASTLYASDALWIENEWGVLACVDPATGAVRDSEQDRRDGGDLLELLGTEDHSRQLVVSTMGGDILAITTPSDCGS